MLRPFAGHIRRSLLVKRLRTVPYLVQSDGRRALSNARTPVPPANRSIFQEPEGKPKADDDLAVRELGRILHGGFFDRRSNSTAKTHRFARKPNRDVAFDNASPWLTLFRHLPDSDSSIDYARECMVSFNAYLSALPPSKALQAVRKVKISQQCIHRIMNTTRFRDACYTDRELMELLAHYVVAENYEEFLRLVVKDQLVANYPRLKTDEIMTKIDSDFHWYSQVLGRLIDVKRERDVLGSADTVLRCCLDWQFRSEIPQARPISAASLKNRSTAALTRGDKPHTTVQLYNQWMLCLVATNRVNAPVKKATLEDLDSMKMSMFKVQLHYFNLGFLLVHHPADPKPDPLLAYFREVAADMSHRTFRSNSHEEGLFKVRAARELETLLRHQKWKADADWIATIIPTFEGALAPFSSKPRREKHGTMPLE